MKNNKNRTIKWKTKIIREKNKYQYKNKEMK
jgi:hypothetical protein